MKTQKTIILYVDGSCLANGKEAEKADAGIGVWHAEGSRFNVSESWSPNLGRATNQRAEIYAAIRALEVTRAECGPDDEIEIRADSRYVVSGITDWIRNWKRNGWKNASRKPVSNADLWKWLDATVDSHPAKKNLKWVRVSGHSGVHGNEMADELATMASARGRKRKREEESDGCDEPQTKRAKTEAKAH